MKGLRIASDYKTDVKRKGPSATGGGNSEIRRCILWVSDDCGWTCRFVDTVTRPIYFTVPDSLISHFNQGQSTRVVKMGLISLAAPRMLTFRARHAPSKSAISTKSILGKQLQSLKDNPFEIQPREEFTAVCSLPRAPKQQPSTGSLIKRRRCSVLLIRL